MRFMTQGRAPRNKTLARLLSNYCESSIKGLPGETWKLTNIGACVTNQPHSLKLQFLLIIATKRQDSEVEVQHARLANGNPPTSYGSVQHIPLSVRKRFGRAGELIRKGLPWIASRCTP